MTHDLAERINSLRITTGYSRRQLLDTYLFQEQKMYNRLTEQQKHISYKSLEDNALDIMDRYARIHKEAIDDEKNK